MLGACYCAILHVLVILEPTCYQVYSTPISTCIILNIEDGHVFQWYLA